MTTNEIVLKKYPVGPPASDDVAGAAPVLAAVWCRSVGTAWTLELHQLSCGTPRTTVVDWISSGVPISQPEPDALTGELLAERGLQLFRDSSAGPCTRNRRGIGYVAADTELIKLAHLVQEAATEVGRHPMILAKEWITAGFSAGAAAEWIRQGVHSPQEAAADGVRRTHRSDSRSTRSATAPTPDRQDADHVHDHPGLSGRLP